MIGRCFPDVTWLFGASLLLCASTVGCGSNAADAPAPGAAGTGGTGASGASQGGSGGKAAAAGGKSGNAGSPAGTGGATGKAGTGGSSGASGNAGAAAGSTGVGGTGANGGGAGKSGAGGAAAGTSGASGSAGKAGGSGGNGGNGGNGVSGNAGVNGVGGSATAGAGTAGASGGVGAAGNAGNSAGNGGASAGSGGTFGACQPQVSTAKPAVGALEIVLDRGGSMATQGKWTASQSAVVSALDDNRFDGDSVGLALFPNGFVDVPFVCGGGPGFPIACGFPISPTVAVAPLGTAKSNAPSGPRHDILQNLASMAPQNSGDNSAPTYDALAGAYAGVRNAAADERAVVLIADGGFSCASLSSPLRPGYADGSGCFDWEQPDTVISLVKQALGDVLVPVRTFVIGLPGSGSSGQPGSPPYHMLLALSTIAANGSPDLVPATCDAFLPFTQNGADPAKPCHSDLQVNLSTSTLASEILLLRDRGFRCTYRLPDPVPPAANVNVAVGGVVVPRRVSTTDTCGVAGCWDYDIANGVVRLLGAACGDASKPGAVTSFYLGCATITK
jgi:hypothetical protein